MLPVPDMCAHCSGPLGHSTWTTRKLRQRSRLLDGCPSFEQALDLRDHSVLDHSVLERTTSCSGLCPLGLKRHPCACLPDVPPAGAGMTTPAGAIILYNCCETCSQASDGGRHTPWPSPSTARRPGALRLMKRTLPTYLRKTSNTRRRCRRTAATEVGRARARTSRGHPPIA